MTPTEILSDPRLVNDILVAHAGRILVGGVLLVEQEGRVLRITKAPTPHYEFGGLYSLPGGLVRGNKLTEPLDQFVSDAVVNRACRQADLEPAGISGVAQIHMVPPVTSYTAKGSKRYTIVFAYRARYSGKAPTLPAGDSGVSFVEWWNPVDWEYIAPANLLILANALAAKVPSSARDALERAQIRCNTWAREVGFP